MKYSYLIICFVLVGFCHSANAQKKLKYKDIYFLIENQRYDSAMVLINRFLKEGKNSQHANSLLQKGLHFERQITDMHIIEDSTAILQTCDSAVVLLSKAKSLITEKELKKNKDYYQSFYRRDLRTGDFGIKLSDVHLDIEKKNQALKKLVRYAKIIHENLAIADRNYDVSFEQYRHLSSLYSSENDFVLMASDDEKDALQGMIYRTDSISTAMDNVRDAVSKLGRRGYSPEINFTDIVEYGVDGRSKADFYQNDIEVWDYLAWSEGIQQKIRVDVSRMKDNLTNTYNTLKSKYDLVKMGGEITATDLVASLDSELLRQMTDLDQNPLPAHLLNIMIDKTRFEFITNKTLNERIADESDVNYQLLASDSIVNMIDDIYEQAAVLVEPYTTDGTKKYAEFIETNYGGEFGLIKFRQSTQQEFEKEKNKWMELQSYWKEKSKWGVSEDVQDSIYLIARTDSTYVSRELSKYYTLAITEDDSSYIYSLGLEFTGASDLGYLAKIGNDRTIRWKVNFDLTSFTYDDEVLRVNGAYYVSSEDKVSAYLYSAAEETDNNFILINADKTGELNWASAAKITNEPVSIKFNDIVKETNIFLMDEEALESYEGDDPIYIVFDRKGEKVR